MLLTRLAFWYLPDPRFTRCLGGFGPKLDPSFGGGLFLGLVAPGRSRLAAGGRSADAHAPSQGRENGGSDWQFRRPKTPEPSPCRQPIGAGSNRGLAAVITD